MTLEARHAILDALLTVLDETQANAIIDFRSAKATVKPFDLYRAKLVVARLERAKDRDAVVAEMLHGAANKPDLTAEYLRAVIHYDPEAGTFTRRETGEECTSGHGAGYRTVSVAGRLYLAHRIAWLYVKGVWPDGQLDHRDRDRANNRFKNLRPATNQQNCWNMGPQRNNTTGVRGVHRESRTGKYCATMRIEGKTRYLGRFETLEAAAQAYRAAEKEHRGHFLEQAA